MSEDEPQDETPKLTRSLVDEAADKLKSLGPIPKDQQEVSKMDAIKLLRGQIRTMRKNGYSVEQIAEALTDCGIPITTSTLSSYIYKTKPKPKTRTSPRSKAISPSETVEEAPVDEDPKPPSSPKAKPVPKASTAKKQQAPQGPGQGMDNGANTEKPSVVSASSGTFQLKPDIEDI